MSIEALSSKSVSPLFHANVPVLLKQQHFQSPTLVLSCFLPGCMFLECAKRWIYQKIMVAYRAKLHTERVRLGLVWEIMCAVFQTSPNNRAWTFFLTLDAGDRKHQRKVNSVAFRVCLVAVSHPWYLTVILFCRKLLGVMKTSRKNLFSNCSMHVNITPLTGPFIRLN